MQKKRSCAGSENCSPESPPPSGSDRGGRFSEFTWRGELDCFGTSMLMGGRQVWIDLRRDSKLPQRELAAISLVSNAADVTRKLEAFKREEAARSPEARREIEQLVIDLIGFYDGTDPDVAEVSFTRESGADSWFCLLKHGEFSNLVKES